MRLLFALFGMQSSNRALGIVPSFPGVIHFSNRIIYTFEYSAIFLGFVLHVTVSPGSGVVKRTRQLLPAPLNLKWNTFPDYYMVYTTADSKIFTIIVNLNLIVVTYNKLMCRQLFWFVIKIWANSPKPRNLEGK